MKSIYTDPRFAFMFMTPLEKWKENYDFVKSSYLDLELFFLKRLDIENADKIRKSWEEWEAEDYKHYKEITDFKACA
jgi:hypothetical protein